MVLPARMGVERFEIWPRAMDAHGTSRRNLAGPLGREDDGVANYVGIWDVGLPVYEAGGVRGVNYRGAGETRIFRAPERGNSAVHHHVLHPLHWTPPGAPVVG